MIEKKEVKTDIKMIIISVMILTLVTLSVSYASFFSVQPVATIREVTAGTLNVIINGTSMGTSDMYPIATSELPTSSKSVIGGSYATLNLENAGTLAADYSVSISYDDTVTYPTGKTSADLISYNWLVVGVYNVDDNEWVEFDGSYYISLSSITPNSDGGYPILRDSVDSEGAKQYRIYVWLDENTPTTEIGKLVYLKLDVKSTISGQVEES